MPRALPPPIAPHPSKPARRHPLPERAHRHTAGVAATVGHSRHRAASPHHGHVPRPNVPHVPRPNVPH
eukprot:1733124-Prymnesium_polylepis.1